MTTFKCKRSGNFVSFTNENDIAGLRKHEGYEEVHAETDKTVKVQSPEAPTKEVLTLRKGKPAKQSMPSFLQD